jgi:hypothetical protein
MTTTTGETNPGTGKSSNEALKEALYKELEIEIDLAINGITIDPEEADKLYETVFPGKKPQTQSNGGAQDEREKFPGGAFYLPYGILAGFREAADSPYIIVVEDGKPVLYRHGRKSTSRIGEIQFKKRHELFDRKTSDGAFFRDIANLSPEGTVRVSYSTECSLKDKGEDCLFCNINYRQNNVKRKTAQQVSEVFSAAVEEGIGGRLQLTGGFIPERRELEYYIDVAEEVKRRTDIKNFNGLAVIGAPQDYSVIDKYKEAGYNTIRMNMEIWDRNIRKTICPGKENQCGGWEHWVGALEYAVKVFGKAKVGSNIVGGIEPKKSILEGIEYLASKGVVCKAAIWRPCAALEGHRTPETSWHLDLAYKTAEIHRKHGFTLDEIFNVSVDSGTAGTIFQIEEEQFENGKLKQWKFPRLKKAGESKVNA